MICRCRPSAIRLNERASVATTSSPRLGDALLQVAAGELLRDQRRLLDRPDDERTTTTVVTPPISSSSAMPPISSVRCTKSSVALHVGEVVDEVQLVLGAADLQRLGRRRRPVGSRRRRRAARPTASAGPVAADSTACASSGRDHRLDSRRAEGRSAARRRRLAGARRPGEPARRRGGARLLERVLLQHAERGGVVGRRGAEHLLRGRRGAGGCGEHLVHAVGVEPVGDADREHAADDDERDAC